MDLRLLQCFVAVAETEHVGRAAIRLHVSQSPLSRQIQRVERELGLALFDRERKRMKLTDAGRWLLGEARLLLDHAARLEADAGRRARGEEGHLSVGAVKAALWSGILAPGLRAVRARHPSLAISVTTMSSDEQLEALLDRRIDVALVHRAPASSDLSSREILREPLRLALPAVHPLARARSIAPRELADTPWILLERALSPEAYDRLLTSGRRAGLAMRVGAETSDRATQLALVEAGLGVAFVPESARRLASGGVALRELPWLTSTSSLHLVHRRGPASPPLTALLAALKSPEKQGARGKKARAASVSR